MSEPTIENILTYIEKRIYVLPDTNLFIPDIIGGLMEVRTQVYKLEKENTQLKKDLSSSDFELNMATSQLMDREKELAECKKGLLKLLPIAETWHTVVGFRDGGYDNYYKDEGIIDELTAKYAENIKPELKRVDCDGVGDNDGFFELKVGE